MFVFVFCARKVGNRTHNPSSNGHRYISQAALKVVEFGWKTMTWMLSEPSIVWYFFNLASTCESARSFTPISFKKTLGFVFLANLVARKSLQSVALRTLPPVPTYQHIEHFANSPTFSFKFLKKKNENIHLFIVCYLLFWVDYYAHSTSLYTICIREGKSVFITYIQKIHISNMKLMCFALHTWAFLTLLSLIDSAY